MSPETSAHDPSVSVIVPVRNECGFIEECLRALLAQERIPARYDVLVVDGMSEDGTREIVSRLAASDARVRMLDNPGRIVSSALNLGIRGSSGEVIVRVDGHTRVAPDFIRANLDLLREHAEAWSVGGPIAHRGKTTFARGVAAAMSSRLGIGGAAHRREDYEGYAEGAVFPAFRRDVFARVGMFDEALVRNQDDEFNFRITSSGGSIYISPRVKHEYFVRETPSGLARQYMQYAYWKVAVFRKHRRVFSVRHVAPMVFVVGSLASAFAVVFAPPPISGLALLPFASYGALLAAAFGAALHRERSVRVAVAATAATAIMHVSYGVGTLLGIVAPAGRYARLRGAMERITR